MNTFTRALYSADLLADGSLQAEGSPLAEGSTAADLAVFGLLKERFPSFADAYQCYFRHSSSGTAGQTRLAVLGFGQRIDAKLYAGRLELTRTDSNGQVMATYAADMAEIHQVYDHLFKGLGALTAEPQPIGWFGGWHCVTAWGEPSEGQGQSIASFYQPEVIADQAAGELVFANEAAAQSWQPLTAANLGSLTLKAQQSRTLPPLAAKEIATPDCQTYIDRVTALMPQLSEGELQKIVVGRSKQFPLARPTAPEDILAALSSRQPANAPGFTILFREGALATEQQQGTWLSITPELLAELDGDTLQVAPLAGTRQSGADHQVASHYRDELAGDDKERREHDFAADLMTASLLPLVQEGSLRHVDSHSIIDLGYVQHLKSTMAATLREFGTMADVLGAIYPPATIWGLPLENIAEPLEQIEPFAREYFTGGYGYLQHQDQSRFALFIRCAKLAADQQSLTAYAGSGIVDGSDPFLEWQETGFKMQPFTELLTKGSGPSVSRSATSPQSKQHDSAPS